jgi:hypothetical protein
VFDSPTVAARRLSEPEGRWRVAPRGKRVVACGVALAAAVVMVQVAANLVDFGVYHYRFAFLDPNNEGSLFAWISGLVIAFAACLCFVRAWRVRLVRGRYLLLGVLLGLLAAENRVRLREQTVHRPLVYVPLLGVLFVALVWTSWPWPRAARGVVWAGLASLVFSFALHKVAPHVLAHYGYGPGDWPYEVKVSLKESGEVCGWILIATGLVAAAPTEEHPQAAVGP